MSTLTPGKFLSQTYFDIKPVTKLVIACQGDWSPWEENL